MAAFDAHKNFAYSTVATAPSPATSGASLVVASGEGTKFPAVPFNATIWPVGVAATSANAEIVRVTGRSTDTLTITRAQEGTSARTVVVGDQIAATVTALTLTDIEPTVSSTFPSSAKAGQLFYLSRGQSKILFTYDGSNWYSEAQRVELLLFNHLTVSQTDQQGSPAQLDIYAHTVYIKDAIDAGCTVQLMPQGMFGGDDTSQLHAVYSLASTNDSAGGSANFLNSGVATSTAQGGSGDWHYAAGSWQDGPTTGTGMIVGAGGMRTGGGGGKTIWYYEVTILVRYKK